MNAVRIGVVTVKGPAYHPTARLSEAASARGAEVVLVNPYRHPPGLAGNRPRLGSPLDGGMPNALLPRQGAEIKTACLPLIAHFEQAGIPVVNGLRAILLVRHKFLAMQTFAAAGLGVPDTFYVGDGQAYAEAVARLGPGPVVVKPVRGRQGSDIALLQPGQRLPVTLADALEQGNGLLVQAFIDPAVRQDLRVLVVGGQVVGAMALTPAAGEFRSNFHLGAHSRAVEPSPEIAHTALGAAEAVGLEIAGVDLMRLEDGRILVLEANYAPGFRGLEEATGMDVAGRIIDHVLSRL